MSRQTMHPLAASSFSNLLSLISRYGCEARYLPRLLSLILATLVRQPLIWASSAVYGRRVRQQSIEPDPIFIIGHWRSGTTHLQNLLSQDSQFGRVTLLQAAMPHEFLILPQAVKDQIGKMLPSTRFMDEVPVAASVPWEEELALTATGRLSFYHVSFFPKCMGEIFEEAVMFNNGRPEIISKWEKQYVGFLRQVQLIQPSRRLLLKNPANTARIEVLKKIFPEAKFIHLHRNPYKVFASSVHLYLKSQQAWGLHRTDRDRIAKHILDSYPRLMNAYLAQRSNLGGEDIVEISFERLQENPIESLRKIYIELGLDGFDRATPRFEEYLQSQKSYKKNKLPLSNEEKSEVAKKWAKFFEHLGYSL